MKKVTILIIRLCVLYVLVNCHVSNNNDSYHHEINRRNIPDSNSITSISKFVEDLENKFILNKRKDVVLMLGITGSGKSTVTSLLTNSNLTSVELYEPGSGLYIIKDENELITDHNSFTVSKTLIPNSMIDEENNVLFYDCPGFEDTRGIEKDISVAYLIKKLLDHTTSLKLLLALPYDSIKPGGDKSNFRKLLEHTTKLIKNIDKFRNGIGLIVTKVDSAQSVDDKIITQIGYSLINAKQNLNNETGQTRENMIKIIDIFLNKKK